MSEIWAPKPILHFAKFCESLAKHQILSIINEAGLPYRIFFYLQFQAYYGRYPRHLSKLHWHTCKLLLWVRAKINRHFQQQELCQLLCYYMGINSDYMILKKNYHKHAKFLEFCCTWIFNRSSNYVLVPPIASGTYSLGGLSCRSSSVFLRFVLKVQIYSFLALKITVKLLHKNTEIDGMFYFHLVQIVIQYTCFI